MLRIERAARVCPPLREAFAEGRLSWVQAYTLVPLLLEPAAARHRGEWVEHAQRVSVRRLGDDVERALALGDFAPPPLPPKVEEVERDCDPAGLQTGAITRLEKLEAMLDHALATSRPKKRARRDYAVFERDGWRCTAPGCTSYRNLHRHHIVFRSHCGSEARSNLTTPCAWHHQRGIHQYVLRCTGAAPGRLLFELGLRAMARRSRSTARGR